jgi:hypothetical protein
MQRRPADESLEATRPRCAGFAATGRKRGAIGREAISKSLICRVSSAVEQRFCKPLVGSSNLSPGTEQNQRLSYDSLASIFPENAFGKSMGRCGKPLASPPGARRASSYVLVTPSAIERASGLAKGFLGRPAASLGPCF